MLLQFCYQCTFSYFTFYWKIFTINLFWPYFSCISLKLFYNRCSDFDYIYRCIKETTFLGRSIKYFFKTVQIRWWLVLIFYQAFRYCSRKIIYAVSITNCVLLVIGIFNYWYYKFWWRSGMRNIKIKDYLNECNCALDSEATISAKFSKVLSNKH